jgi:hypothetical protein
MPATYVALSARGRIAYQDYLVALRSLLAASMPASSVGSEASGA